MLNLWRSGGSGAPFWEPWGSILGVLESIGLHFGNYGGLPGAMGGSSGTPAAFWGSAVEFSWFFCAILGAILDGFWETKLVKKSMKNHSFFLYISGAILRQFGEDFGVNFEDKLKFARDAPTL